MPEDILPLDETFADEFCRLRLQLFEELGEISQNMDISQLKKKTRAYYLSHINTDLFSWGVLQNEVLISIGSLCLFTRIPYKKNLSGLEGYILNIYTVPQARERGFATQILEHIIQFSQKNSVNRLWLNSSEQGQHLYAKLGFVKTANEMERFL